MWYNGGLSPKSEHLCPCGSFLLITIAVNWCCWHCWHCSWKTDPGNPNTTEGLNKVLLPSPAAVERLIKMTEQSYCLNPNRLCSVSGRGRRRRNTEPDWQMPTRGLMLHSCLLLRVTCSAAYLPPDRISVVSMPALIKHDPCSASQPATLPRQSVTSS